MFPQTIFSHNYKPMLTVLDDTLIGKRVKYVFIKDSFYCIKRQREIVKKDRNKLTAMISENLVNYLEEKFDMKGSLVRVEFPSIAMPVTKNLRGTLLMIGILKFSTPDVQMSFYPFHVEGATTTNTVIHGDYLWRCWNNKESNTFQVLRCEGLSCPGLKKDMRQLREIFDELCDDEETYAFPEEEEVSEKEEV